MKHIKKYIQFLNEKVEYCEECETEHEAEGCPSCCGKETEEITEKKSEVCHSCKNKISKINGKCSTCCKNKSNKSCCDGCEKKEKVVLKACPSCSK